MSKNLDFDKSTNTLHVGDVDGVEYLINGRVVKGDVKLERDTTVTARPARGRTFEKGIQTQWNFEVSQEGAQDPQPQIQNAGSGASESPQQQANKSVASSAPTKPSL